jgi:putative endonuclease
VQLLCATEGLRPDFVMGVWARLRAWVSGSREPTHLVHGKLGERVARRHLRSLGLKFLTANYASKHGEIDLIFRDGSCLVFVEVKARSADSWTRPAAAVNARKRRAISKTALAYLRHIHQPQVPIRFDIVEVILADGCVLEVRHLPNTFTLSAPYRYG